MLRVVAIGDEGKAHLEVLRKLARGTRSLLTENHVVPLWHEVHFEDIVFTVCPYVGYNMRFAYGKWAKNSVGDIVDMILQALEVSLTPVLTYCNDREHFRQLPSCTISESYIGWAALVQLLHSV